jgi:fumarate reductase subunit C
MDRYPKQPILDMTPDGQFRKPRKTPIATRIAAMAIIVAVAACGLAVAALALWLAFLMIPVVVVAGLIAYIAFRFQVGKSSFRSARERFRVDIFRN